MKQFKFFICNELKARTGLYVKNGTIYTRKEALEGVNAGLIILDLKLKIDYRIISEFISIVDTSIHKVGRNNLINRLNTLSGKIKYEWLNYSFDTYKLKCKTLLLTWQQYKQPDGQLIKQNRTRPHSISKKIINISLMQTWFAMK